MKILFMSLLFLIFLVPKGTFGIKCYSCSGESCKDPYTPPEGDDGCEVTISYDSNKRKVSCQKVVSTTDKSVTRGCVINCLGGCGLEACTYCCSDADYCNGTNGGTPLVTSWVAMGVALAIGITISKP